MVINGIQLEGVTDTGTAARASLVSLRLDLSVPFRRSSAGTSGASSATLGGATPNATVTAQ
jgi:hypothetical protein